MPTTKAHAHAVAAIATAAVLVAVRRRVVHVAGPAHRYAQRGAARRVLLFGLTSQLVCCFLPLGLGLETPAHLAVPQMTLCERLLLELAEAKVRRALERRAVAIR